MRFDDPHSVKGQFQSPGQVMPAPVRQLGGGVYGQFPIGLVMGDTGSKRLERRMFLFGGTVCILYDNICLAKPFADIAISLIDFKGDIAPAVYVDPGLFDGLERIMQGRQGFVIHLYQG